MKKIVSNFPQHLVQAAKQHPGGWVYQIEKQYASSQNVPPEAILGAWKVDKEGNLTGEFLPNSQYKPITSTSIALPLQEVTFLITADNLNLTLLTPEFLQSSGIIPSQWELARIPLLSDRISQIAFTNGINIVAEYNTIAFTESFKKKDERSLQIASVARRYTQILANANYRAVSINPSCFVTFPNSTKNAGRDYIAKTLLAPGEWLEIGTEPVRAAMNLHYTLDRGRFNLAVAEAKLQLPDSKAQSAVLFSGSFRYELKGNAPLQELHQHLDNWQADWQFFREVVENRFLKGK